MKIKISYFMFYKTGIGGIAWRQIIKLENYDLCLIKRQNENLPVFNSLKEYYNKMFPTMPKKCPFQAGKYSAFNVTVVDELENIAAYKIVQQITPASLPNGVYRHLLKIHTRQDSIGFMLIWHTEIYDKMGENLF